MTYLDFIKKINKIFILFVVYYILDLLSTRCPLAADLNSVPLDLISVYERELYFYIKLSMYFRSLNFHIRKEIPLIIAKFVLTYFSNYFQEFYLAK